MLEEFRLAYVRLREDDVTATPDRRGRGWRPDSDSVPEAAATTRSPGPTTTSTPWHLAFTPGVRALRVEVGRRGRAGRRPADRVDADEVRAKAAEQAARLHARL